MIYDFYVVGVGGTGSLLARDLPQLLINTNHKMIIIDGDLVEKKNVMRQSFQEQDIGYNKAIALARKINSFYSIECEAMDQYLTKDELKVKIIESYDHVPVIIGCVDNDKTRMILETTFQSLPTAVYIDSANSEYEGNVYVSIRSNGSQYGIVRSAVYPLEDDLHPTEKSCQNQILDGNVQYMVTNAKMAVCILEHCFNLISKEEKITGVTKIGRFTEVHF